MEAVPLEADKRPRRPRRSWRVAAAGVADRRHVREGGRRKRSGRRGVAAGWSEGGEGRVRQLKLADRRASPSARTTRRRDRQPTELEAHGSGRRPRPDLFFPAWGRDGLSACSSSRRGQGRGLAKAPDPGSPRERPLGGGWCQGRTSGRAVGLLLCDRGGKLWGLKTPVVPRVLPLGRGSPRREGVDIGCSLLGALPA